MVNVSIYLSINSISILFPTMYEFSINKDTPGMLCIGYRNNIDTLVGFPGNIDNQLHNAVIDRLHKIVITKNKTPRTKTKPFLHTYQVTLGRIVICVHTIELPTSEAKKILDSIYVISIGRRVTKEFLKDVSNTYIKREKKPIVPPLPIGSPREIENGSQTYESFPFTKIQDKIPKMSDRSRIILIVLSTVLCSLFIGSLVYVIVMFSIPH